MSGGLVLGYSKPRRNHRLEKICYRCGAKEYVADDFEIKEARNWLCTDHHLELLFILEDWEMFIAVSNKRLEMEEEEDQIDELISQIAQTDVNE